MEVKLGNSQVIDLNNEICPMNLVKFKFYFSEFSKKKESFVVILGGEGLKNVESFLKYKNTNFKKLEENKIKICFSK